MSATRPRQPTSHRDVVTAVPIDRASPADLAMLALDRGDRVPQHLGVVLLLDPPERQSAEEVRRVLVQRTATLPCLRRRLFRTPLGCGRPIWMADPGFDPGRHVRVLRCPAPGDEAALLHLAAEVMTRRLPRSRPPWAVVVVPGLAGDRLAVMIVLHHVLADGLGGLAILSRLVDGAETGAARPFPRPAPRSRDLAADALRSRVRALGRVPTLWRESRRSMGAVGGLHPPRAEACSLLAPTGPRRRLAVVRADLAALRRAAHASGGTLNDVLLAALGGAVRTLLAGRGERVDELRVAVMVTGRRTASADTAGNLSAPLLVGVPTAGTPARRLQRIAGMVAAARASAAGQPPIAVLQPLFRLIAAAGLYRWYMNHQRRVHLLVSNVPGPPEPVTLAGCPVTEAVPLGVGEAGNLTLTALALSYAGTLAVTLVVDPDRVPDLDALAAALQAELDGYAGAPGRNGPCPAGRPKPAPG